MAEKTYKEKLLDRRWEMKRLEILQRDGFKCTDTGCSSDENETLHIHHLDYIKGAEPWDYPNEYLQTLCAICHKTIADEREMYESKLVNGFRLHFKDSFKQMCAAQVFKSFENIDDIMYLLWEIGNEDRKKVYEILCLLSHERDEEKYGERVNFISQ